MPMVSAFHFKSCLRLENSKVLEGIVDYRANALKHTLTSISELNENELKLITYKCLNDLAPKYLRQLLIRNSQQSYRALRNTVRDLKLPPKKTNNGQKGYSSEEQKLWNGLSAGAKRGPSLASFKSYL